MNQRTAWILIGVVVVLAILAFAFSNTKTSEEVTNTASSTPAYDKSISDGTVTIAYPSKDFGLATNPDQVLAHAYIPPCDPAFDYCFYYTGNAYAGTNFESAGIRVEKRADLSTESACLQTPPAGYDASTMPTDSSSADTYSVSFFADIGDAGAGHYANGSLYRLFVHGTPTCYEIETRIGATQFANYPDGTIQKFDDAALKAELQNILAGVSFGGKANLFSTL